MHTGVFPLPTLLDLGLKFVARVPVCDVEQVRLLEADNKVEPETLERWKGEREKAERESAKANVAYVTMREIIRAFKEVPEEQQEEAPAEAPS